MMRLLLRPLLIFIISASVIFARPSVKVENYNKSKLKLRLLSTKVGNLEKKLQSTNLSYLSTVKKRQKIDMEIFDLERALAKSIATLQAEKEKLGQQYKRLMLGSFDEETTYDLYKKKITLLRVRKQKESVQKQIENEEKLRDRITALRTEFQNNVVIERELFETLKNLEQQKSEVANKFIQEKENNEKLAVEIKKIKRLQTKKKSVDTVAQKTISIDMQFSQPVSEYVSKDFDKKGITYIVKDVIDIKASQNGKIVYKGTLANYGNVIMLDHGNSIRSIYLGDFSSNIKKGTAVREGQIIGKTRRSIKKNAVAKVYFEVRKKNIVQNTVRLVKNNQVSM